MIISDNSQITPSSGTVPAYHTLLSQLRHEIIERYRPYIKDGPGPIRMVARIVADLEIACRAHNIPEDIIASEIVNRTIGDINLRLVTECEGAEHGSGDYRQLADELGIALPGEQLSGYNATGKTYLWLRDEMMNSEKRLLEQHLDARMYDIYGIGYPLLRNRLSQEMQKWGLNIETEQVAASLGAMDGIDKVLRGLHLIFRAQGMNKVGVLFPEPGFGVPEWQAHSFGYQMHHFATLEEHNFKLTGQQLATCLTEHEDIRVLYLTIANNPTAFAYTPGELNDLFAALRTFWNAGRHIYILTDLAYIGTGKPDEDMARMLTFAEADVFQHTVFVSSFSKTHSLTGERFGWVSVGDVTLMPKLGSSWTNTIASLPGEWQLRFMAYLRLFEERPWLAEKLRNLYRLRRQRFIAQLQRINAERPLFKNIYLDDDSTVYNWSRLQENEDAFSLFEKTGIAGVPGSGFGYTDDYVRFSVGVVPPIA